jgi:hypothetical protein
LAQLVSVAERLGILAHHPNPPLVEPNWTVRISNAALSTMVWMEITMNVH